MSFLGKLFGGSEPEEPDKMEYLEAMSEMAAESERTYRGMIDTYSSDVALSPSPGVAAAPTALGLYKARLFGAVFMATAYIKVAPSPEDGMEFVNAATGLAFESPEGAVSPRLDRNEAVSIATPFATRVLKAILAAYDAGAWLPGNADSAHLALAEHLHETLADSISEDAYTAQVKERFEVIVQGTVAAALAHSVLWAGL